MNNMFSKQAPSLECGYSSQDSKSLKSILDASMQSSYGSCTSYEDIVFHSAEADDSQPLSSNSNESDHDSQPYLSTTSARRYHELLPFNRVDLLSRSLHGSDSHNSSASASGSLGYRSPEYEASQLLRVELANAKGLVEELRKHISQLKKNEVGWKIQIQVLEAKLETSRSMYDSLLERINGLSVDGKNSTTSGSHSSRPTFHDLFLDLRKRNTNAEVMSPVLGSPYRFLVSSGKSESIAITNEKGRLSEDIERMVREAEEFASEDANRKRIESLNSLSSFVFGLKSQLADQSGLGGKLEDDDKKTLLSAIKEVTEWIDDNGQSASTDELEEKLAEVQSVVSPITSKLYASSGADESGDDDEPSYDHDEL